MSEAKKMHKQEVLLTGMGRCRRCAAILAPGASNVTVGAPKVTPRSEERAPPREWPTNQMLASGYKYVRLLYRFLKNKESVLVCTRDMNGL